MLTLWEFNPLDSLKFGFTGLALFIDGIVYWCVSKLFTVYVAIAGAEIITSDMYNEIVQKFEVIIGVFMLFYIAYALLKSLINPDELSKNTTAIVKNFIISLVLLTVIPVIFDYAFKIQNIIIKENKIAVLLYGDRASTSIIESTGNSAAWTTLTAFLEVNGEVYGDNIVTANNEPAKWKDLEESVKSGNSGDFLAITSWADPIHHKEQGASYIPIISTLCGGFLIYILISFCLDLGIRVVKLSFYQTIAPIPIMMRIIPEKKSVFDNWVKVTLNTYLEVFIRIFIMYFVIYLIDLIIEGNVLSLNSTTGEIGAFGLIFIILGLFAFAKQAPKLIGDVIGIDAGNLKLGIKDKLAAGGALTAGAFIGGGATALVRNGINRYANGANWSNKNGKFTPGSILKNFGAGILSGAAGGISGAVRSGYGARNAKGYGDMARAAGGGAAAAVNKRDERAAYKASHGGSTLGAIGGHFVDAGVGIKNWATGGIEGILSKTKFEEDFKNSYNEYEAIYESPNYNAMKSQLQQYEALKASGVTSYEGKNVEDAIKELKGNMLKSRLDSIRGNTQSAAYAMYNIAQLANKNPNLAKNIGIDVSMVNDLELKGNKIIDKTTNAEVSAERLYEMIEGTSLTDVSYDNTTKTYKDSVGAPVDFISIVQSQNNDGMSHQKKKASDQLRKDQLSVEYKEAKKRQESKK